ncbi:hypothetical protein [Myxococcus qinghaiensis]|uniref:hypothetical protein n=1 Tax=Myxococcus qinghaiensis TaxID=2906758 RepID=UPI0020A7BEBE|nr:hypothetical protein [Myxococcus qinghaiensis]MCP3161992.1 hypothetical protein [Myxococcus qinghaiensis]
MNWERTQLTWETGDEVRRIEKGNAMPYSQPHRGLTQHNALRITEITSMSPRKQIRKPIPKSIITSVLTKSARNCALCFGLKKELTAKQGQIAHIDGNRANHKEDNLAFLCLEHHDQLDSQASQSKGLTQEEVKFYRNRLYYAVENWDPETKPRSQPQDHIQLPQYGSVREMRIDILQKAMRQAGIWTQRLTSPARQSKPPQDLLTGFTEAFAEFQRARLDALLYVDSETAATLGEMAHSLSRAHLYRTKGDLANWMRSDEHFENYATHLSQVEDRLRKLLFPMSQRRA